MSISIHAPLTGSDAIGFFVAHRAPYFNPRSPYGERHVFLQEEFGRLLFQSTLPLRGATFFQQDILSTVADFNPRSPYGERLLLHRTLYLPFSFQSTLPLRGATHRRKRYDKARNYFNPRSPYGERLSQL